MRQHSVTTHPEEFEKIPNFFSKIKKSLEEEENIHFKSQFLKIEENSLWNFYKPCFGGGENNHHVICKFCNKMLSMVRSEKKYNLVKPCSVLSQKVQGPFVYFIKGRSPSRHKQRFCI